MTNPLHQLAAAFAAAAADIHPAAAHQLRQDAGRVEAQAALNNDQIGTGVAVTYSDTSATVRSLQPSAERNTDGTSGLNVDPATGAQRLAGEMAGVGKAVLMKRLGQ